MARFFFLDSNQGQVGEPPADPACPLLPLPLGRGRGRKLCKSFIHACLQEKVHHATSLSASCNVTICIMQRHYLPVYSQAS